MTTPQKNKLLLKPLTDVEQELMNVIWDLGECTVKDVQTALSQKRDLAYTSVATIMKILEQKGVLRSSKDSRPHSYIALIVRSEYEAMSLRHLATHLFHGDPSSMVMRLLNDSRLSTEELETIRKLLNKGMGK